MTPSLTTEHGQLAGIAIRRIAPADLTLKNGDHGLMECDFHGEETYVGVAAVLLFPVSHPRQYVSLRYVDSSDKEQEIGVIEELDELSLPQQELVEASLIKQYHEQIIERILSVNQDFGQLFFRVVTQRGVEEFVMPWRQDRAEDWGSNGKVLLDSLNNRYLVPDVDKLTNAEKRTFKTHVYW